MPKDDQIISELEVTVECACGNQFSFTCWDENFADNPYIDKTCKCGKHHKTVGSLKRYGGRIVGTKETGRIL